MKKSEWLLYVQTMKRIIDRHYEKEMVFYDGEVWYSRYHGRNISPEEIVVFVLEISNQDE